MREPSIPAHFEKIRRIVLRAIDPIRSANPETYFYGERTKAGGDLPPYYLVHFLFIELLRFARLGQAEKVAWSIPIDFKGTTYVIEHRKLGLGLFAQDKDKQEEEASEIVGLIQKGVQRAEPFFDWLAEQAVRSSEVNVVNHSEALFGRFEFLLEEYRRICHEADANKGKSIEEVVSERPNGKTMRIVFPEYAFRLKARWMGLSAIEAFFSWTEHMFIHLAILMGNIVTADEVSSLAAAEWKVKFSKAIDAQSGKMPRLRDELLAVRREIRNHLAHGSFGKEGQAFDFHSTAGAVPVLLPHKQRGYRFSAGGNLNFNEERALRAIEEFNAELWSGEREPARHYIHESHSLPTILTLAADGRYRRAMRSMEDMEDLVNGLLHRWSRSIDMDW